MRKRYDELMDKIEVTGEMRIRILHRLQHDAGEDRSHSNVLRFSAVRKYVPIAACLAILLLSPFVLPKIFDGGLSSEELLTDDGSILEVSSLAQLEETVHFEIQEISGLPFTPERKTYIAYGGDMAEILYENGEQTACFRKSRGQDDNSGDYNEYAEIRELSAGTVAVTLKGDAGLFTLALWSDGGFSYSISLSDGITEKQWDSLLMGYGG